MKYLILLILCGVTFLACEQKTSTSTNSATSTTVKHRSDQGPFYTLQGEPLEKIDKTDAAWKSELDAQAYHILREEGTERAGTGALLHNKQEGVYTCAACSLPLFTSATKFESGTGWPSFYQPINSTHVGEHRDTRYGMVRTEVHCGRCGGHQGHVFTDGPAPTGLRYCINSAALDFVPISLKEVTIIENP